MGEDTQRNEATKTGSLAEDYSFDLPDNFMDDVRASIDGAVAQVTDALPSLSDILAQAQFLPGVPIARDAYLREALEKKPLRIQEQAIATTPRHAGLTVRELSKLARKQQGREARRTTVISFAAGFAGGAAAAVTIPADLAQFYGHLMRMIQMLTYLFGWRDTCTIEPGGMSDETRRAHLLLIGVCAGDEEADVLLERVAPLRDVDGVRSAVAADATMDGIEARLAERMAKRVGGQVVGKSVPIAGAIISGSISYGGFSDMCHRLRKQLEKIG